MVTHLLGTGHRLPLSSLSPFEIFHSNQLFQQQPPGCLAEWDSPCLDAFLLSLDWPTEGCPWVTAARGYHEQETYPTRAIRSSC